MNQTRPGLGSMILQMLAGQALPKPDEWINALQSAFTRLESDHPGVYGAAPANEHESIGFEATNLATQSFRHERTLPEQAARVHVWLGTLKEPERNLLVQWLDARASNAPIPNGPFGSMAALVALARKSLRQQGAFPTDADNQPPTSVSDPTAEILAALATMVRHGWTAEILPESCRHQIVMHQTVATWLMWFQACREAIYHLHGQVKTNNALLGRFELLKSLGSGSFGEVYEARDTVLGRTVALKLPKGNAVGDNNWESIRQEAKLAAAVDHPNVVPLLEVGDHQGRPFLISSIIRGPSMRQWLDSHPDTPIPPRQAAKWISMVAQGVQAIHDCGILHCDLKPANILLDASGADDKKTLVPRITDFGLGGRTGDITNDPMAGPAGGTPATMAPEQLRGRSGLTVRTDVYALGAMLHELLCRNNHHNTKKVPEITTRLESGLDPVPPQVPIPADLDCIRRRCLEPASKNRYASASEVSSDLQLYLAGRAPTAAKATRIGAFMRFCKRRPVLVSAASITSICIISLMVMGAMLYLKLEAVDQEKREATTLAQIRLNKKNFLEQQQLLTQVRTSLDDPNPGAISDSMAALRRLAQSDTLSPESAFEIRSLALRAGLLPAIEPSQPRGTNTSYLAAWHPQSKWLAVSESKGKLFLPSVIDFIDMNGGPTRPSLRITPSLAFQTRERVQDGARAMAIDPSGRWMAVGTRSGWVNLYDLDSPKIDPCDAVDCGMGTIENLSFHDGSTEMTAANRTGITRLKLSGMKLIKLKNNSLKNIHVNSVAICTEANKVITSRDNAILEFRDIQDTTKIFPTALPGTHNVQKIFPFRENLFFRQVDSIIEVCAIKERITGDKTSSLAVQTVNRLTRPGSATGQFSLAISCAAHPSGNYVAMAMQDNWVRIWETFSGRQVCSWYGTDECKALAFSPDGQYLATTGGMGALVYRFQVPGLGMPLSTGVEEPEMAFLDYFAATGSVFTRSHSQTQASTRDFISRFRWPAAQRSGHPEWIEHWPIDYIGKVMFHRPAPATPEWFIPAVSTIGEPAGSNDLWNSINPLDANCIISLPQGKIMMATTNGLIMADRGTGQVIERWINRNGVFQGRAGMTHVVACSSGFLATGIDGKARLFDQHLKQLNEWHLGKYALKSCSCPQTPGDTHLAVVGDEAGNIYLLDTRLDENPPALAAHRGIVNHLQSLTHNGQTVILSAGNGGKIRFWGIRHSSLLEPWAEISIGEDAQILSVADDRIVMGARRQYAVRPTRWQNILDVVPEFRNGPTAWQD